MVPKEYDISTACQQYILGSSQPLDHTEGMGILLELQSFCRRIADIIACIHRDLNHIEVLKNSAASLPVWVTKRWKTRQRRETEVAAWPVVRWWSDAASREEDYQQLLEEGRVLVGRAEVTLGLKRYVVAPKPRLEQLTWVEKLSKAVGF